MCSMTERLNLVYCCNKISFISFFFLNNQSLIIKPILPIAGIAITAAHFALRSEMTILNASHRDTSLNSMIRILLANSTEINKDIYDEEDLTLAPNLANLANFDGDQYFSSTQSSLTFQKPANNNNNDPTNNNSDSAQNNKILQKIYNYVTETFPKSLVKRDKIIELQPDTLLNDKENFSDSSKILTLPPEALVENPDLSNLLPANTLSKIKRTKPARFRFSSINSSKNTNKKSNSLFNDNTIDTNIFSYTYNLNIENLPLDANHINAGKGRYALVNNFNGTSTLIIENPHELRIAKFEANCRLLGNLGPIILSVGFLFCLMGFVWIQILKQQQKTIMNKIKATNATSQVIIKDAFGHDEDHCSTRKSEKYDDDDDNDNDAIATNLDQNKRTTRKSTKKAFSASEAWSRIASPNRRGLGGASTAIGAMGKASMRERFGKGNRNGRGDSRRRKNISKLEKDLENAERELNEYIGKNRVNVSGLNSFRVEDLEDILWISVV